MSDLFSLNNQVAVVTGGLGQIGLEYCKALLAHGARVAVFDLGDPGALSQDWFADAVQENRLRCWKVDITKRSSIAEATDEIATQWEIPSVLVNNAALDSPPNAPKEEVGRYEDYPESSFDRVMEVNVKGMHLCCQEIGGRMAEAGRGSIINISSTYGIMSPCQDIYEFRRKDGEEFFKPVAYSVSKSAVLNLTRYLATYWAKSGVRVNTLTPGGVFNNQPQEFLEAYCPKVPMGRMAEAHEMAGGLIYLASKASSFVTGSNLVIDGGMSAW
jgi:NAD(P)-dependent dehydrogenase (short-subunit alcohol dehydrogenase family)